MNNFKYLLAITLMVVSLKVSAGQSMRRCMLLPIKDTVGGAVAYKVFEDLEKYLKNGDWCYYQSNSEILDILGNFKKNLDTYLENPEVLKILSEKTKAGSLIKIRIDTKSRGTELQIKVIGENGDDIYFSEKTILKTDDITVIVQTLKNWLALFEKTIPYDARVVGVLGNQFTIDLGKASGIRAGDKLFLERPVRKKRHPLLKEIVDWEKEKIAEGKIFHVAENQSQGKVIIYEGNKRLALEDWINFDQKETKEVVKQETYNDTSEYEFGKMGRMGLFFHLGTGSATKISTQQNKIKGILLGIDILGEIWATRNYWASLEIGRKLGSLKKDEGTLVNNSNSATISKYEVRMGYKYLPMGYFYGPQVDGFIGYGSYSYGLDTQVADGFTEFGFKGLLMGARGSMPLQKQYRIHMELSFLFNAGFEEDVTIYGPADSASSYGMEFGGSYAYSPNISLLGAYEVTSNKAKFNATSQSLKLKENTFKVGATFTF
jgi:hypothetical protein